MLKNITSIFSRRIKTIKEEIDLKSRIDEILVKFIKEDVLNKKTDLSYKLSYTVNKGIIRIETDNKIIAQEIALRIRILEAKLRDNNISFKKILI